MMGLTAIQSRCLVFVRDQIAESGVSPSYREIADHLGIKSKGQVSKIVDDLAEHGALVRIRNKARTLALPAPVAGSGFLVNPHAEVRRAIEAYARQHHISVRTAAEEALRVYFVEAAGQ
ncbi:LexA family protein [Bradyrhizobium cenepequi]